MNGKTDHNEYGTETIDALPINILIVNKEGVVTHTNRAFEKTFGKGYIKNLDKGPGDLFACENSYLDEDGCGHSKICDKCSLRNFIKEKINKETETNYIEIELTLMGGYAAEKKWYEVYVLPMYGIEEHYIVTFNDITLHKEQDFLLMESSKGADAANKAKSEFLASMSHEIRTPLNGVIGMLELTLLTELDAEQKENLEVAKNCAANLLSLINDILDFSKAESNKVILSKNQFDLRELIRKVSDTHMAKVAEKNLLLECIVDENLPHYFSGDEFRLQQVLNNLVSNAIKFTEKGSVCLEVKRLCGSQESCTIVFSVEDSGIGISPNEIGRLFKPFSQIDGSISRKYGGTGLGLAISQNLVGLMDGEIKVKSKKDVGSTFYFTIQMNVAEEKDKEETIEIFESKETHDEKILVVEDDRANQLVIRQLLKKLGYKNVKISSNGFNGIKQWEQNPYDLIMMDIQMPELNGIDATHIIREKEKHSKEHVPIVALTAYAMEGDEEKFLNKGMDSYLSKPIDIHKLKKTLQQIFEGKIAETKMEEELKQAYAAWRPNPKKEEKTISVAKSDKRAYRDILDEVENLLKTAMENQNGNDYLKAEKKIHELKIKAQNKKYEKIRAIAFRAELAARKKDGSKTTSLLEQINEILMEK